jgi:hypothetical protein
VIGDLEGRLDAAAPAYMAELRASEEWGWADTEQAKAFLILEHLRLWLLDHRGEPELLGAVWDAVEELAATDDELLLDALMAGLLEGWWPKAQQRMMGSRTRALWDQMRS